MAALPARPMAAKAPPIKPALGSAFIIGSGISCSGSATKSMRSSSRVNVSVSSKSTSVIASGVSISVNDSVSSIGISRSRISSSDSCPELTADSKFGVRLSGAAASISPINASISGSTAVAASSAIISRSRVSTWPKSLTSPLRVGASGTTSAITVSGPAGA